MPAPAAEPPMSLLAWVEQTLGGSTRVVGCARLTGGLTSHVHGVPGARGGGWWGAAALVGAARAPACACFVHRDYQHFNLLWSDERLTGVLDWVEAGTGPRELDVGHCRLNLTILFSADVAERFLAIY